MNKRSASALETPLAVTRTQLLDIREEAWRKRIDVVSLAAEILDTINVSHREQALLALGVLYKRETDAYSRARLLRRWPTVHVVATSGVAADHYEAGSFWPKLTSLLGIPNDPGFHREWGEAFHANLERLLLPTFEGDDDAGTRYVGRILMHSGMPTYCLRDFFRLINDRRAGTVGLEPEDLVSWASALAAQHRLYDVDKPVSRFLQRGGTFAVDVTDRSFDLLDALTAGGDGADVPLPDRFKAVAHGLRADGALHRGGNHSRRYGRVEGERQPRLVVDPFGQGVLLRLPAVGEMPDGPVVWLVELDGASRRVSAEAPFPGVDELGPPTDVLIPSPVRSVAAALAGRDDLRVTRLVVDDKDPFLAFGEDMELLPPGLPIPAGPAWLLFPGEAGALQTTGEKSIMAESLLPPGWSGWCLLLVDLERASQVGIGDGPLHAVRHEAAARVVTGEAVRGVRTSYGSPIVSDIPRIKLPGRFDRAQWDVTLLDDAGEVISHWTTASDRDDPDSVWEAVAAPVVGHFTVRVRGPWGRGVTRTVDVVQGLSVSFDPPWRRFVDGGLQPCTGRLTVAAGIDCPRTVIAYAERNNGSYVRVGAHGRFQTLMVTPPHMTVSYQHRTATIGPAVRPLRLSREDIIQDPGTVILDLGTTADPELHLVSAPEDVQTITPSAGRDGIYRFDLARIVDSLAAYPRGRLALDEAGELRIADIQPRSLFRDVELRENVLEFSDCVNVDGLTALVYSTRAPWRGPAVIPVSDGHSILPKWQIDAGPLRVFLRIEDPWAPHPIPGWPNPFRSKLVDADGWVLDANSGATALSTYLAGMRGFPEQVDDFTRLWSVRARLGDLALGHRTADVAEAIDGALHREPRKALLALTGSEAAGDATPSLVITAGLAWADLGNAHDAAPPLWTMRDVLPAALLSAADAEWSDDEIEAAIGICGDIVPELLNGEDRYARSGRIDEAAEVFDRNPEMRGEFVRRAGLIPQGILSADSRVIAAMELVKERRSPRLEWLMGHARNIHTETERMVRTLRDPVAQTSFDARGSHTVAGGWRLVPGISLGLALVARHAARGNTFGATWLRRQTRVWADIAGVLPRMVTIDLIIAELLVAGSARTARESKQ